MFHCIYFGQECVWRCFYSCFECGCQYTQLPARTIVCLLPIFTLINNLTWLLIYLFIDMIIYLLVFGLFVRIHLDLLLVQFTQCVFSVWLPEWSQVCRSSARVSAAAVPPAIKALQRDVVKWHLGFASCVLQPWKLTKSERNTCRIETKRKKNIFF